MDAGTVMDAAREALWITALLAAPPLLVALIVGLVVGIFQAATQVNESTLSFIPKLLAIGLCFVLAGPWMLGLLTEWTARGITATGSGGL